MIFRDFAVTVPVTATDTATWKVSSRRRDGCAKTSRGNANF